MAKNSLNSSNFEISLQDELQQESAHELFGRRVTRSLEQNLDQLPDHISQRLHDARALAISKKKPEKSYAWNFAFNFGSGKSASSNPSSPSFWRTITSIGPIVVLFAGLIGIAQWQQDARIDDIADLDAALLSDEVPPDAYADNGFLVFLKNLANQDKQDSDSSSSESALTGR